MKSAEIKVHLDKAVKKVVLEALEVKYDIRPVWQPAPKMCHTIGNIEVRNKSITCPAYMVEEILQELDMYEIPYMVDMEEVKKEVAEIELSANDKMIEIDIEPKNETTEEPKEEKKEKKPSTAKIVNEMIMKVLNGPKNNEAFEVLTDQAKCHELLKIRYAFLKEVTENDEDRKINGFARYAKKVIEYEGKNYWTCNDLYKRNIKAVEEWAKTMK